VEQNYHHPVRPQILSTHPTSSATGATDPLVYALNLANSQSDTAKLLKEYGEASSDEGGSRGGSEPAPAALENTDMECDSPSDSSTEQVTNEITAESSPSTDFESESPVHAGGSLKNPPLAQFSTSPKPSRISPTAKQQPPRVAASPLVSMEIDSPPWWQDGNSRLQENLRAQSVAEQQAVPPSNRSSETPADDSNDLDDYEYPQGTFIPGSIRAPWSPKAPTGVPRIPILKPTLPRKNLNRKNRSIKIRPQTKSENNGQSKRLKRPREQPMAIIDLTADYEEVAPLSG
jgi:hypothetical protein